MTIKEIISLLEEVAPLSLQEDYDNSGLLTGNSADEASGAVLCLDCTEAVIDEAIESGANLIIAHHPLIFGGVKRLTGSDYVQRCLIKAIKNNIAIYACHTNIDNVHSGVNKKIADKLGLQLPQILAPKKGILKKLVTFVPMSHHEKVLEALFASGAGNIGNYDNCSFNLEGTGTFRGNENTDPFIGKPGELSREPETRVEVLFEASSESRLMQGLRSSHPYEEIAYDIYTLDNLHQQRGSGMWGLLEKEMTEEEFLGLVKKAFQVHTIKHTAKRGKTVKKVAVCGGSGRFLLRAAIATGADAFITSDFKYHEYFDADGRILLLDIGHYESEQFTPEIFYEIIRKKFATFAIHLSKISTNPVNYF
jgi:dinuclear metal center YbgI/SA1388 family protein